MAGILWLTRGKEGHEAMMVRDNRNPKDRRAVIKVPRFELQLGINSNPKLDLTLVRQ
jgi:hypothetical protein